MTLWHLLWMHVTGLGIFALLLLTPFAWGYGKEYSSAERWRRRSLYLRVIREYLAGEERRAAVRVRIAMGARTTKHRFEVRP
jgi:hypothetical protein